ncbi:hypothetical protein SARC_11882 [Sphaeroforma arctica JP610]|uniref:Uncharacterized protein n=1 Tax=Sphaeroforma arctica JP610 TaxID=667725 RepID=A0A0L0FFT2_9EUKA|nr:hypothetical protein SARC_11882 [Sphaeroforma arctica JP610]KNC75595.1 hypothetical protein SARC_11882 [Sphaeroforma arctica JP610]|eukprot:XP_014149497.1 hypothetical protein SARC_11882 [Sphaeroforma arctica JP610]
MDFHGAPRDAHDDLLPALRKDQAGLLKARFEAEREKLKQLFSFELCRLESRHNKQMMELQIELMMERDSMLSERASKARESAITDSDNHLSSYTKSGFHSRSTSLDIDQCAVNSVLSNTHTDTAESEVESEADPIDHFRICVGCRSTRCICCTIDDVIEHRSSKRRRKKCQ